MTQLPRLGINIDHIATVRNARGGEHPFEYGDGGHGGNARDRLRP